MFRWAAGRERQCPVPTAVTTWTRMIRTTANDVTSQSAANAIAAVRSVAGVTARVAAGRVKPAAATSAAAVSRCVRIVLTPSAKGASMTDDVRNAEVSPIPQQTKPTRPRRARRPATPTLRFTPLAWAKLLFLRDLGDTEVGGFAVSSTDDLLLVHDVRLIRQLTTAISVKFADDAVAEFFDEQVDAGL